MTLDRIIQRLDSAPISAPAYRTAMRLLFRTHPDNGYARLTYTQMAAICDSDKDGTMRRHLADLAAANLITYRCNSDVHVYWHGWEMLADSAPVAYPPPLVPPADLTKSDPPRDGRAENTSQRAQPAAAPLAESDPPRAGRAENTPHRAQPQSDSNPPRDGRAENTPHRAGPIRTSAHAVVGWLVDPLSDPQSNQPTNHGSPDSAEPPVALPETPPTPPVPPAPPPPDAPSQEEQARTVALLTDPAVAVGVKRARLLAAEHRFEYVRRVVAMFWDRLQSGAVKAGKVITALDDSWGAPALDERFMATDFYRRHRLPEEVAAEAEAERAAAQQAELEANDLPGDNNPAAAPDPPPEPGTPASYWAQLQQELAIEQGGSFDRWVHDTWVIAYNDGRDGSAAEFLIGLPDAFRYDWIVHRLSRQIKRKLAVILGHQVDVKFRVQPRPLATNGSNA